MSNTFMTERARRHLTALRELELTWGDIAAAAGTSPVYASQVQRGIVEPSIAGAAKFLQVPLDGVEPARPARIAPKVREEYVAFRSMGYSHRWAVDRIVDAFDAEEATVLRTIKDAGLGEAVA